MNKICSNCNNTAIRLKRSFCGICYSKWLRYGDPNQTSQWYKNHCGILDLNLTQNNLIIGSLLGDAYMRRRRNGSNASIAIMRAEKDLSYLQYQAQILHNLLTSGGIFIGDKIDKRTNKNYRYCNFTTKCLTILNPIFDEWYKDKIKIVPENLTLTGEIVAYWFCDDGTFSYNSKKDTLRTQFATNSFNEKEVNLLAIKLSNFINNTVAIQPVKNKQFILHLNASSTIDLITKILPYFPEGMDPKMIWNDLSFLEKLKGKRNTILKQSKSLKVDNLINLVRNN